MCHRHNDAPHDHDHDAAEAAGGCGCQGRCTEGRRRKTKAVVFDIQRASFHDGPGIRTTVFLKGCPLRCAWCHNPESQRRVPELSFRADRCIGCQQCVSACHRGVHHFVDGRHEVDFSNCGAEGHCVEQCPADALAIFGRERSVAEVMEDVRKDKRYYETSGGGLTISGGEPTLHRDFCRELLDAAQAEGIHTCIETCGFNAREVYEELRSRVDLWLFDWKATDSARHEALTGVRNEKIRANLQFLHDSGAQVFLRCPMIPGVNDTPDHVEGIAALRRELPNLVGIEVLAYHSSGEGKYDRIGRARPQLGTHVPNAELKDTWKRMLAERGADALVT